MASELGLHVYAEIGGGEGNLAEAFRVEVKQDLDEDAGEVEIVPQEIGRVLLNLLGNAFDAVHEHAAKINGDYAPTVTVSTQQVDGQLKSGFRTTDRGFRRRFGIAFSSRFSRRSRRAAGRGWG